MKLFWGYNVENLKAKFSRVDDEREIYYHTNFLPHQGLPAKLERSAMKSWYYQSLEYQFLLFEVSDFELNMFSQDAVLKINNRFSLSNYFPVLRGITHHSSRIGLVVKAPSRQIRPKTSAIRIPFRMNTLRCGAKKFVTHQIVYSWNKQSPLPGTACRYFINLNKLMYSLWQITGAGWCCWL